MRWFKHFSDNHRGQSIQSLFQEFGHTGVACYYILMEMYSEKLENITSKDVAPKFSYSCTILRSMLRINSVKTQSILSYCQTLNLLRYNFDGKFFEIEMPIMLNLLDRDMKRPRKSRAIVAQNARLEEEEEEEEEKEKEEEYIAPSSRLPATRSQAARTTFSFVNENNFHALPESAHENWLKLYDAEYLNREVIKVLNWLNANPKKNKRTVKGWVQFLSNWFERGWTGHLRNAQTAVVNKETTAEYVERLKRTSQEEEKNAIQRIY